MDFACTLFSISMEAVPLELFLPKREEEVLGGFSKAKSSWDLKLKISLRLYSWNNKTEQAVQSYAAGRPNKISMLMLSNANAKQC